MSGSASTPAWRLIVRIPWLSKPEISRDFLQKAGFNTCPSTSGKNLGIVVSSLFNFASSYLSSSFGKGAIMSLPRLSLNPLKSVEILPYA